VVLGLIIGSGIRIGLVGPLAGVRWVLSGSTRSVVFLIKYLVWETVHHNAFVSKIGSENRFRRFSGCQYRPVARLEWFRRKFKIPLRNFEASRRNRRPHASFLCKSVPVSVAGMMAVLDLMDEGAEQNVASKFDRLASGKTLLFCQGVPLKANKQSVPHR
jgi:hypothetical protein